MNDPIYVPGRPDELNEAARCFYRAECRVRCLESALDRLDPARFDGFMDELEEAKKDLYAAGVRYNEAKIRYNMETYERQMQG